MQKRLLLQVWRGWLHAVIGAATVAVVAPVGGVLAAFIALAAAPLTGKQAAVLAGLVLGWTAALLLAGWPRWTREVSISAANRLLHTGLPAIPSSRRPADRLRCGGWLVLHAVVGSALIAVGGFAVLAGVGPLGVWLTGGGGLQYFGAELTASGLAGTWTLGALVVAFIALVALPLGAAALLRRAAPSLLGPSPAERLEAAERDADRLAHRNQLARELHDSIGHTLTASTVQAAAAGRLLDTDPERARRALAVIEESCRTAMGDLDHVLGVLRESPASTAPARTLADLAGLLEPTRAAGIDLTWRIDGDIGRVPGTVSREAYRIVQEGVTNALRHADGAPTTVDVSVLARAVRVTVVNAAASAERRGGRGLAGVAERVRALGGDSEAGRGADGLWRLTATLPIPSGT